MNPWDVDITKLTGKYIQVVKEMTQMNYNLSGKVLLASAILLKMKSNRLVDEDINNFDAFLFHTDEEELFEELDEFLPFHERIVDIPQLGIRTPQARKRKISVNDLVKALEKALRVDNRRKLRLQSYLTMNKPKIPERNIDIHELIEKLHIKIKGFFSGGFKVTFSDILPSQNKQDKILTLLPLLYLHNQKKVNIEQEKCFDEINIEEYK